MNNAIAPYIPNFLCSKDFDMSASFKNASGNVQVWLCHVSHAMPIAFLMTQLHHSERLQAQRIKNEETKKVYMVAHILLRKILSRILDCRPQDLIFKKGTFGKPVLQDAPVHFNISHTCGLAAVAVANIPVGIDVEHLLVEHPQALAHSCFTQSEAQWIEHAPNPARMFRKYWVMKEAVVKAMGSGMAQPLNTFSILPDFLSAKKWGFVQVQDHSKEQQKIHVQSKLAVQLIQVRPHWDAAVAVYPHIKNTQTHPFKFNNLTLKVHWLRSNSLLNMAHTTEVS